jgi:biotin-(acetyl-CoA carboxylase) ligase
MGLNLGRLRLPAGVAPGAVSLAGLGAHGISREALLHSVLVELGARLDAWNEAKGGRIVAELKHFDTLLGRPISVGDVRGVGEGIGDDGCLLIRDGRGGLHRVRSGHVEHD